MTRLSGPGRTLALGVLLVATVAAYRGVVHNGFVYDDAVTVEKNPAVRSLARAPEWLTTPHAVSANRGGGNYRPIVVASYALDYALWGERPAGFHATNVVVHLAAVVLVFVLGRRLWSDDLAALVAAGWMALHPFNSEAVNYVTARSSTLAALGVLAAVALYDRYAALRGAARLKRLALLGASLVCGLFALGAKESAAVLPLLIMVWDRARFGGNTAWRTTLLRSAPFWGVFVAWLFVRSLIVPGGPWEMPATWAIQGAAFAAKIVAATIVHSVWPVGLAVDYGWPVALGGGAALAALAGVAGIAVAWLGLSRIDGRMGWCGAWFGVSLLPVLVLPFVTRIALYQEHRAYLAQVGVAWLAGGVAWWSAARLGGRRVLRVAIGVAAIALTAAAVWADARRTAVWADKNRLWDDVLAKYPDSAVARGEIGLRLLNSGRLDEAERELLASLRSMPNYVYTYVLLGMTYAKRGDMARAIDAYRTALEFRPSYVEARIRLGLAYEAQGLMDDALAEYDRAIRDDPWASPALVFAAAILEQRGETDEAIARLKRVAPDDPIYDDAQLRLGELLLRLERWAEAREAFAAHLARVPQSREARYYLELMDARERQGLPAGSATGAGGS